MKKKSLFVLAALTALAIIGASAGYVYYTQSITPILSFVSSTEYQSGEPGQIIVKVHNVYGIPITAYGCNVSIYYPDKTLFVDSQAMTQGGAPGSWYYQFTPPFDKIGVYEAYVTCNVSLPGGRSRILSASKAFHVSQPLSLINETSSAMITIIS